jgi:hypothetical protein
LEEFDLDFILGRYEIEVIDSLLEHFSFEVETLVFSFQTLSFEKLQLLSSQTLVLGDRFQVDEGGKGPRLFERQHEGLLVSILL